FAHAGDFVAKIRVVEHLLDVAQPVGPLDEFFAGQGAGLFLCTTAAAAGANISPATFTGDLLGELAHSRTALLVLAALCAIATLSLALISLRGAFACLALPVLLRLAGLCFRLPLTLPGRLLPALSGLLPLP